MPEIDHTIRDTTPRDRLNIVYWVLIGCTFGIVSVSMAVIAVAAYTSDRAAILQTSERVFNAVLPLLGTWVGIILAYYFSRSNFELGADNVRKTYQEMKKRLRRVMVKDVMTAYGLGMSRVEIDESRPGNGENIPLKTEFLDRLGPHVTRIPVFDKQHKGKYIIHQSYLYKFVADITLARVDRSIDINGATLKNFLDHDSGRMRFLVTNSIAYVAIDASLADTKAAMERRAEQEPDAGCQDVYVTKTGAPSEAVLGWVTNVDITRHAKA